MMLTQVLCSVKKGKPELRKKVMPAVIIRQRKTFRRKDGQFIYFEDNAGVIVNNKGEMKGSAITGEQASLEIFLPQFLMEYSEGWTSTYPHNFLFLFNFNMSCLLLLSFANLSPTCRPCGEGVRRPLAEDCFQCQLHLLSFNCAVLIQSDQTNKGHQRWPQLT